jgi:hypothetical protein
MHILSLLINFIKIEISGKNPENKEYLLCGAGKISVNKK